MVHNRVSLRRQDGRTTPIECLSQGREIANLTSYRVWGCEVWVIIRRATKHKLDAKAEREVHLGVSPNKKAWVVHYKDSFPFLEDEVPGRVNEAMVQSQHIIATSENCSGGKITVEDTDDDDESPQSDPEMFKDNKEPKRAAVTT
uniref:Retroviral polymerase SH3-like domain-containing protein n=1 Tax=Spongospora subterranea TaxID=70186 RepID=A0A0H5QSE1_9EUKA|eukprot:CRZ04885.1 hypothetical protein [Spongospora subterranea]